MKDEVVMGKYLKLPVSLDDKIWTARKVMAVCACVLFLDLLMAMYVTATRYVGWAPYFAGVTLVGSAAAGCLVWFSTRHAALIAEKFSSSQ